ncbi:MAG: hypothetical protein ACOC53_03025 [Candidatus Saliniplasma sp.]
MEGIKLTDQNLFTREDVETAKRKVHSIVYSEGDVNLNGYQNTLEGHSTLNSYEVEFFPQRDGTGIRVKYGLTTIGLILGIILLVPGVIFGVIILLLWYLKMDEVKSSLGRAFPMYVPPQGFSDYSQIQGKTGQYNQSPHETDEGDSDIPPPPEED